MRPKEPVAMTPHGSVSVWIERLKQGESAAATPLWRGYFERLVRLAQRKLSGMPSAGTDGEDVALSAFNSFCRGVAEGRFPDLDDRDDLWQVLIMLTARKAINLRKRERALKRGGRRVQQVSPLAASEDSEADAFAEVMGREPTPELAAQVAEECRRLLDQLSDAELRAVAVAKMEGYSNAEIAERLGLSLATVERKLGLIRKAWQREVAS
jgi:DNA-directed RNA polymerase specialized sigma24 family protein